MTEYIISTTREWDPHSNRFNHPLHYVERNGQRKIYDNPSTETGKKLLTIARQIMGTECPCKLSIVVEN